ncbi:MAG: hypothetical protein ACNS60_10360 [Candidatus Cyclobacteriaceae bacterium M2_1C_046]
MATKEQIKEEIDKLPESLLDQVYLLLKKIRSSSESTGTTLTIRDFKGQLDKVDIRKNAYE